MEHIQIAQIDLLLTDSIIELEFLWRTFHHDNILFGYEYLSALEASPPSDMSFLYACIQRDGINLGLIYFQLVPFNATERLKLHVHEGYTPTHLDRLALGVKRFLARQLDLKIIIGGSLLAAGPYGFYFKPEVETSFREYLMHEVVRYLMKTPSWTKGAQIFIIKDLPSDGRLPMICRYKLPSFYEFTVQPIMIMNILAEWQQFEDYMSALQSKYRVKIRKVLKSGLDIKEFDLDLEQLKKYNSVVIELYLQIANAAGFNLVELNENYFLTLKEKCSKSFTIKLLFVDDQPVAFYCYFISGPSLNAHYVGYDRHMNNKYELYHNLLLKFVKAAIYHRCENINFARTAMEIKSSLGAEPVDYYSYIAHRSRIYNKVIPHLLEFLKPNETWTQRSPFKDSPNLAV